MFLITTSKHIKHTNQKHWQTNYTSNLPKFRANYIFANYIINIGNKFNNKHQTKKEKNK